MAENKMAEVAEIFGKKLNEPFTAYELGDSKNHIGITSNGEPIGNHVMFSERGVVYVDVPEDEQDWLLISLLTGKAEILSDDWRVQQTLKDLDRR